MNDVPATVPSDSSTSGPSEWHTIRPWTPHLTLAVREITSVSATFILSSSLDTRHATDDEPEPELVADTPNDNGNDVFLDPRGIIADAVSHGLSVDVNGSIWQRVILRMNDHADEAIIVIYGLHPGRQYDIDLALVSGGTMRRQVTTEDADSASLDDARNEDGHSIAAPEPLSASASSAHESLSSASSTSQTPAPEERMRTLSHQLDALHAEQATLQAALKSSRRDANKTATNLRAEIEVLKRASERAGIAEGKARQRVRAHEDAVRRANESREQVEQTTTADEQELIGLGGRQSEAEKVLITVRKEADAVRAEREKREEEGRKRKESIKGECATLGQKLERLTTKKEKLENSVVPDLEAQLTEIQREIEVVERGGFQNGDIWDNLYGEPSRTERRRQSHPGTIGRPSAPKTGQPPISPPHVLRHQPRSQSIYQTSTDLTASHSFGLAHSSGPLFSSPSSVAHSASSLTHSTAPALSHFTNTTFSQSPSSSSLSRSTSSVGSSTLSSKAPPFEPTRKLRLSPSSSSTSALPPGVVLSMKSGSQVSFSTAGAGSTGLPLSGAHSSTQRTISISNRSRDADVGDSGNQVQSAKSSTTRGSSREGPQATLDS